MKRNSRPATILVASFALAIGISSCTELPGIADIGAVGLPMADSSGQYILTFAKGSSELQQLLTTLAAQHGLSFDRVFSGALNAATAEIPAPLLVLLRAHPDIAAIEPDYRISIASNSSYQSLPWGIDVIEADATSTRAGDGSGSVDGVRVFVVDSGIRPHPDLNLGGGRAFVRGLPASAWYDENGHGTHVAGTIGARDNSSYVVGAAPGVPLYALRVLDRYGSGSVSNIVAALDWLTILVRDSKTNGTWAPTVVNLSLGGPSSYALDAAVRALVSEGAVVVVAAGNNAVDAAWTSPARVSQAITVGAFDNYGRRASFSNYGSVVDLHAPGVGILSTGIASNTTRMSGTSMAAPHVAGAAALYLSNPANRMRTPAQVSERLVNDARAIVTGVPAGTTNRALYLGGYLASY
jgi:subtilisin family serine protease